MRPPRHQEAKWAVRKSREAFQDSGPGRQNRRITDDAVMVVSIEWSPGLRPGRARRLFEFDSRFNGGQFDLAPDGKRFLMVPLDGARATRDHLRIELGWADRL